MPARRPAPPPPGPDDDLRLPSIDGMRAFEAAARLGSFERAALELNVTASAIGKRVGTLERQLETALLARGGGRLALTASGRDYLEQVRGALAMLAAIPLHRRPMRRARALRIVSPPTFARQVLVPRLAAFTGAHPGLELEVMLSIPAIDSARADGDVEIRNGDPAALGGRQLMQDVVLPVAAPALLARLPALHRPADLRRAPLLRTPLEQWTTWFEAAGLDWPEPARGPRFDDLGLLLEAAVSGQGVALARPSLARHWLASGTLVPLFRQTAVPRNQYCVTVRAGVPEAETFAQWLARACRRVSAEALEELSRRQ